MDPASGDIDIQQATAWTTLADSGAPVAGESPTTPSTIGRYEVLGRIGSGGMGNVYAAHDPELSRKVALKVLGRVGGNEPLRTERLRREAQALAQLSDENVVNVYDVGVVRLPDGDDRMYIAMQLIEGIDLAAWLGERRDARRTRRLVREIVDVFIKAGRGLAAAHDAGLVHRDFKPANVLIGNDGGVRVADFGLATAASPREDAPPSLGGDATAQPLLDTVTMPGVVAGTPSYMAPEQFVGDDVDSRTDQFAFCVALYEALYGQRPFEGRTFASLRRNVTRGRVRTPPRDSRVPARLRRVALRGLSVDPDLRYPGMPALVHDLSRDPAATARRLALPAAAVIATAAAIAIVAADDEPTDTRCTMAASHLVGVWDADVENRVNAAFSATNQPHAAEMFTQLDRRLDAHLERWVEARTDACEATHLRGEQSPDTLDLRMRCLDRRLSEARATVELLASNSDAELMARSLGIVAALPGPERCEDVDSLRAVVPLPNGSDERAEIAAIDAILDEVGALQEAGRFERGLELARSAVARALETDYAPILARGLFLRASLEDKSAEFAAAEASYYEALTAAGTAREDRLSAATLIGLVTVVGDRLRRHDDAVMLHSIAEAAVRRAGDEAVLRAELDNAHGKLLIAMGRYPEAEAALEHALAIRRQAFGDGHPDVARTHNNLAVAVYQQGRLADAETHYRRAIALAEDVLGEHHPHLAAFLSNLGTVLTPLERFDEAQEVHERALAIRELSLGLDHPHVANSLGNLGNLARDRGDLAAALTYYERALKLDRAALGADHPELAQSLTDIGDIHRVLGDSAQALSYFEQAIELLDGALGEDHPSLGRPLTGASRMLLAQGKTLEAVAHAKRAVTILEAHSGDPAEASDARAALTEARGTSAPER